MNNIVKKIRKWDSKLYEATFFKQDKKEISRIWNKIKNNTWILKAATTIVRDKFNERDTFLATTIVEYILKNHIKNDYKIYQLSINEDVNKYNKIYLDLVNKIYSDVNLGRIVLNGGYSFLLYTIMNDNLKLTEEQKLIAINEAMNKIVTLKHEQNTNMNRYDEHRKITIERLNKNQSHGVGNFDIRYYILKNHNFKNQIEDLLYMFYPNECNFSFVFHAWKWDIVNNYRNKNNTPKVPLDNILFITDEEIENIFSKKELKEAQSDIKFIQKIHKIRYGVNKLLKLTYNGENVIN